MLPALSNQFIVFNGALFFVFLIFFHSTPVTPSSSTPTRDFLWLVANMKSSITFHIHLWECPRPSSVLACPA